MREKRMNSFDSRAELARPSNISLISDYAVDEFVARALGLLAFTTGVLLVADDPGFLSDLPKQTRLGFTQAGLDGIPIKLAEVSGCIQATLETTPAVSLVIVDMRWVACTISAPAMRAALA